MPHMLFIYICMKYLFPSLYFQSCVFFEMKWQYTYMSAISHYWLLVGGGQGCC